MCKRRLCILGGCGGISRSLVAGYDVVAPSAVDATFLHGGTGRFRENGPPPPDIDAYGALIPMRQIAVANDASAGAAFARAGQRLTGQTLWMNGGAYMP